MCMRHVVDVDWNQTTDVAPDVKMTFSNAGHILGSSAVHLNIADGKHNIVFSGDQKYREVLALRCCKHPFPTRVKPLSLNRHTVQLVTTSHHVKKQTKNSRTLLLVPCKGGGKLICPVFAVGRSQEVMIAIDDLFRSGAVEPVPVWLDGMIQEATAIHASHPDYLTSCSSEKSLLTG